MKGALEWNLICVPALPLYNCMNLGKIFCVCVCVCVCAHMCTCMHAHPCMWRIILFLLYILLGYSENKIRWYKRLYKLKIPIQILSLFCNYNLLIHSPMYYSIKYLTICLCDLVVGALKIINTVVLSVSGIVDNRSLISQCVCVYVCMWKREKERE